MNRAPPSAWRERAQAALSAGQSDTVRAIITARLAQGDAKAADWNSAGNLLMKLGDSKTASSHFAQAALLDSGNPEFALNNAIALVACKRFDDALEVLAQWETSGRDVPAYCSTRGTAERGVGNLAAAAQWYDRALALDPARHRALHGRARVALERAEAGALQQIDKALAALPGEADLWLARAQALDAAGETAAARDLAEQIVAQAPQWIEGLTFLAQLRLADGEEDFTAPFRSAAERLPDDPAIPVAWAKTLAGLDFNLEAAEVASRARKRFASSEILALIEASYASAAGDDARAAEVFATLHDLDRVDRWTQEAVFRIRTGAPDLAAQAIDRALALEPWDITAWALRGMVWRMLDDDQAAWLHEQDGLVALLPLVDPDGALANVTGLLHSLHDGSPLPLGQSLRGGTQTRDILFNRTEPECAALRDAIVATLETYRQQLPPHDAEHPLLRHRDAPWRLAGSWSVRLSGGGDYHAAHIHPQGILSSALYVEVPQAPADDPLAGALELGRPPPDQRNSLPPISTIVPRPGHLALFPSTLYHGTRPFTGKQRMTVAFDVVSRKGNAL